MRYQAAAASHLNDDDAQLLGAVIERLTEQKGSVTPEDIVTAARDEASPAHRYFEWNDQKAAQQYRLEQARYILRVIHVEIAPQETIRAFHSVHIDEMSSTDRQYVSLKQVQSNDRFRQQIIEGALNELR